MDLQLLVDVAHVKRDGGDLNSQSDCRRLVVVAFDEKFQEAQFVRSELVLGSVGRANLAKQLNHLTRYFGRHRRTTVHSFLQTFDQERRRRLFQLVAAGPSAQRVENHLIIVIDREHQQQQLRVAFFQQPNAFNAVHSREADVHQHDIG